MGASAFDILGLGCVAVDDLFYVPTFPEPDGKLCIQRHERQCGGLAATALVAASRLGARCAYAGDLGEDELSVFVRNCLKDEGIDISLLRAQPGVRPIHSIVIVDQQRLTRTILFDLEGARGAPDDWPLDRVITASKVLLIDHFGAQGMLRAARIARGAGVPVVADFESRERPEFPELLALVDHLILSHDFAAALTGQASPAVIVNALWTKDRATVAITRGSEGCWFRSRDDRPQVRHQPAFSVQAVDTTGCGDVFHGAYACALTQPVPAAQRIKFASAAAALKATQRGGQSGIPNREAVESFLREYGS